MASTVNEQRVNVVLDLEQLDDGEWRVHMIGVYPPEAELPDEQYDLRNVVQTWLGVHHDAHAFRIGG